MTQKTCKIIEPIRKKHEATTFVIIVGTIDTTFDIKSTFKDNLVLRDVYVRIGLYP